MRMLSVIAGLTLFAGVACAQEVTPPPSKACGAGPHEIVVLVPVPCDCQTRLSPLPGGRYQATQLCPPPATMCSREQRFQWTDWPECPGASPAASMPSESTPPAP